MPPPEIPPLPPEPRAATLSVSLSDPLPSSSYEPELVLLVLLVLVVAVLPSERRTVAASRVTAPLRENSRPLTFAPLRTVMPLRPKTVPTTVPSTVAELLAIQYTLHALAPLVSVTLASSVVVSDEPVLKTNVALSSPPASRVTVPETVMAPDSPYTPEVSVPEIVRQLLRHRRGGDRVVGLVHVGAGLRERVARRRDRAADLVVQAVDRAAADVAGDRPTCRCR